MGEGFFDLCSEIKYLFVIEKFLRGEHGLNDTSNASIGEFLLFRHLAQRKNRRRANIFVVIP
jgi:hypothetical protein